MLRGRKRRSRYLDWIIIIQVIVLIILVGILVGRKDDGKDAKQQTNSVATPTPIAPIKNMTPTPIPELTVSPTIEPTTAPGVIIITPEATKEEVKPTPVPTKEATNDVSPEDTQVLAQAKLGTMLQADGAVEIMYYMQTDSRWASKYYGGTDTIEEFGCGPTCMAIVVSSLTDTTIDPELMCQWANENGYWFPQSGSLHTLIPDVASKYGLSCEGVENNSEAAHKLSKALSSGKLVVALMGKGNFTNSGHFIVLRGITEDGLVYVADPMDEERTNQTWELSLIVDEAKSWAAANGPFWIISK